MNCCLAVVLTPVGFMKKQHPLGREKIRQRLAQRLLANQRPGIDAQLHALSPTTYTKSKTKMVFWSTRPETEFLDISFTKDSSLLLYAIQYLQSSTGRF
jgi:hypothetical protein